MAETEVAEAARRPKSRFLWFFFLLALTNLIWAAQGTAVKFLDPHLGPIAITFLPFYVTTVLLVPLLVRSRRAHPSPIGAADWRSFAIAGICGQVLAQLGMTWGISISLASNGAVMNLMMPVITAVLASIMLKEKVTVLRWGSLLIGLAGVMLLSMEDVKQSSLGQVRYLGGNLLILGGCLGSSFYNVYCKGLLRKFQEVEILIFSYVFASVATVPLLVWVEPFHFAALATFDWRAWAAFVFLALLMYGASMLLFFYVLQHLDVTIASVSLYMVPVFGVLLSATILGERLSGIAMVGAVVVLVSTVLIMKLDATAA
jgi:drug/metabolite transporter (DMT)-like permease